VILDSQSVKPTAQGGPRGAEAGKKDNGRKRSEPVQATAQGLRADRREQRGVRQGGNDLPHDSPIAMTIHPFGTRFQEGKREISGRDNIPSQLSEV
jgi:hypothetical protein